MICYINPGFYYKKNPWVTTPRGKQNQPNKTKNQTNMKHKISFKKERPLHDLDNALHSANVRGLEVSLRQCLWG